MNQEQLDTIKARALAALPDGAYDLEKVKAVAEFREHARQDVIALIAEVERLQEADAEMLDWIERQIGRPVSLLPLVIQDVVKGKRLREAIERVKG